MARAKQIVKVRKNRKILLLYSMDNYWLNRRIIRQTVKIMLEPSGCRCPGCLAICQGGLDNHVETIKPEEMAALIKALEANDRP